MRIYVKVGTMPAGFGEALRIRKAPYVGQRFTLRWDEHHHYGYRRRSRVVVDLIKDVGNREPLVFVGLI